MLDVVSRLISAQCWRVIINHFLSLIMALNEADPAQGCTIGGGQGEGVGARLRKVPGP